MIVAGPVQQARVTRTSTTTVKVLTDHALSSPSPLMMVVDEVVDLVSHRIGMVERGIGIADVGNTS